MTESEIIRAAVLSFLNEEPERISILTSAANKAFRQENLPFVDKRRVEAELDAMIRDGDVQRYISAENQVMFRATNPAYLRSHRNLAMAG